jgi:hypothetical protein
VKLTWLKDGRHADGRAHALSKQNLVIFGSERSHHETKDVEKGANQDELTRTVLVIQYSNDGTLFD